MANIKFTEFPSATVVGSMDIIPIVQSGVNKKTTAAIFQTYLSSNFVPYTGATTNLNLDAFDLYTAKVWLKDVPNDTFGSMELTDGVLHFEDGDGHSMVTMEDGYLTIANASTIRALLDVSALSANRDFAFPNASGTLALTSQIPSVSGTTNYLPKFTGASALGNSNLINDAAGSLGLGVTPSAWGLGKAIEIGNIGNAIWGVNATQYNIIQNAYFDSGYKYASSNAASYYQQTNGSHNWFTAGSGTAGNAITFTQVMSLANNGAATFSSSVTATQGNFSLNTIGGAIGSVKNLTVANTNGDVGDWAGINFAYYNNTTNFAYIGSVLTNGASNAASDLVFGVKATNSATSVTEYMRIKFGGNVQLQNGLALSGATAPASGIEFPATQVASASANNLDDYEEGTWTIGIAFGGSSVGITYDASSLATYTKIGRQVTVNGFVALTNKGSSTGSARVTGLPFTIANSSANYSPAALRLQSINFVGQFQAYGTINSTTVLLQQTTTLGVNTDITDTEFSNSSQIMISFTYFV